MEDASPRRARPVMRHGPGAFYLTCGLSQTNRADRRSFEAISEGSTPDAYRRSRREDGSTGRRLVQQALDAGHDVRAVTRQPQSFPVGGPGLEVVAADATVEVPVSGAAVVLSTLGTPFTRRPVRLYSHSTATVLAAMRREGVRRLVVVSSSAAEPHHHAEGGFLLNRVIQPLVTATIGKSTYDDMRAMEKLVRDSNLDWTIVRPSGLFDSDSVTRYRLSESRSDGCSSPAEPTWRPVCWHRPPTPPGSGGPWPSPPPRAPRRCWRCCGGKRSGDPGHGRPAVVRRAVRAAPRPSAGGRLSDARLAGRGRGRGAGGLAAASARTRLRSTTSAAG